MEFEYAVTRWNGETAFSTPGCNIEGNTIGETIPDDIIPNLNYLILFSEKAEGLIGPWAMSVFSIALSY
jgi:hypothetical protein